MEIFFKNKVVVVTGGSSGIGMACITLFKEGGASVINLDKDHSPQTGAIAEDLFIPCDVHDSSQISSAFEKIRKTKGKIDVLINNAGVQSAGNLETLVIDEWDRVLNINLRAMFLCSKSAVRLMSGLKDAVIINVASAKTQITQKDEVAYITSKAAIHGLTRSIATDYAAKIRCVTVSPGAVDTPSLRAQLDKMEDKQKALKETAAAHLLNRIAKPIEIAYLIYFLASDRASFITGQEYRIDGGIGIMVPGT